MLEADYQMTEQAHLAGSQEARTQGDEALAVRFFVKPKPDPTASLEAGRPMFKDAVYINIRQPGNKDSVVERVATDMDKQRFPRHWEAYQNRVTDPEGLEGTLLSAWPALSSAQVEELKYFNIRTVEQLVATSDSNAQNIMGFQTLKRRAEAFLEASEQSAAGERIAAQEQTIVEQQETIQALSARLDALEASTEKD